MRKGCRPTIRTGCGFNLRRLSRRRLKMLRQQHDTAAGEKKPPQAAEKHAERAVPAGQNFRQEIFRVFLPYFLYFTKSRKKSPPGGKGFNFVSAKPPLRRAESRFGKPRCSLQRERVVTFCVVQKVTKKHAGLRPATSIQISVRFGAFTEMTDQHQVTGYGENRRASGYRR